MRTVLEKIDDENKTERYSIRGKKDKNYRERHEERWRKRWVKRRLTAAFTRMASRQIRRTMKACFAPLPMIALFFNYFPRTLVHTSFASRMDAATCRWRRFYILPAGGGRSPFDNWSRNTANFRPRDGSAPSSRSRGRDPERILFLPCFPSPPILSILLSIDKRDRLSLGQVGFFGKGLGFKVEFDRRRV